MGKKLKILIGSCGGLTGLYLSKHLKDSFFIENDIYGMDTNEKVATKKYLSKLFKVPKTDKESDFIDSLLYILNEEKIDIYLPTHSKESYIVAKNEDYIRSNTKAKLIVSPFKTFEFLENKKTSYLELKNLDVEVPEVFDNPNDIKRFPIFTKPEIGSGSKDIFILNNIEEVNFIKNKYTENFFMEFITGQEYTVDCIYSSEGNLISYNQRIREKTLGGAVVITKNNFDVNFINEISKISNKYLIKGPCNFQFFYSDGRKILTDINLRFASGGLPLSIESNVKVLEIMIKDMLGIKIYPEEYISDKKNRTMYRYFEEFYEVD